MASPVQAGERLALGRQEGRSVISELRGIAREEAAVSRRSRRYFRLLALLVFLTAGPVLVLVLASSGLALAVTGHTLAGFALLAAAVVLTGTVARTLLRVCARD